MAFKEEDGIVMLMDDTLLGKLDMLLLNGEYRLLDCIKSDRERTEFTDECENASKKVISLLGKCKDFNKNSEHSEQESKSSETYIPEDTPDPVVHAINIAMKRVRDWCSSKRWDGLLNYLEIESRDASIKFINIRRKYNSCYNHRLSTNNQGNNLAQKAKIAKEIQDYVKFAINISLQFVRNCSLRKRRVSKIEAHFDILVQAFKDLNVESQTNVHDMAEHVSLCKNSMLEFAKNCGNGPAHFNSKTYLKLLQKEEIELSAMVDRKKSELGFAGKFDNLPESQQLEVCCAIFNESGTNLARSKSRSAVIKSLGLLVELIFDNAGRNIRDLTEPTFHGLEMPDGMGLALQIRHEN